MSKKIGTHDGNFHADEVLACYMLKCLPEFSDALIVRTRNSRELETCEVVVDVGGEYDPASHRYDHHQRGFSETFEHGMPVKLSSAGLVYKHFGKRVVSGMLFTRQLFLNEKELDAVYRRMYKYFLEGVDGIDNGISQWPWAADVPPLYIQPTTLSARVARLNTPWNRDYTAEAQMRRFELAGRMVGSEFEQMLVEDIVRGWLPGRALMLAALLEHRDDNDDERILVLRRFCPWRDHIHDIEQEEELSPILFVIYPENDAFPDTTRWRAQAVNVAPNSFVCRNPFPEAWRGIGGKELSSVTGIPGCVFVHAAGFIGGNQTFDGALEMAKKAIRMSLRSS